MEDDGEDIRAMSRVLSRGETPGDEDEMRRATGRCSAVRSAAFGVPVPFAEIVEVARPRDDKRTIA
jgi:hypothetical protein